jgi:hypothetical protein
VCKVYITALSRKEGNLYVFGKFLIFLFIAIVVRRDNLIVRAAMHCFFSVAT